jgi:hypothetical protein
MVFDPKDGCVRNPPEFYEPISYPAFHKAPPQMFGTREHFESILRDVSVGNWELHLRQDPGFGRFFLQIQFLADDSETGETAVRQHCRKWYLSPHMTKSEVVRTAYLAYTQAVLHEADETFKYCGRSIYNPHINVDALGEASFRHDARK